MGPKLSPKEPAGAQAQDATAQLAAAKAEMDAFLKGTPTRIESVKLPAVNKVAKEFGMEIANATKEYTKNLKQSLEESGGALTNPKSRDKIEAMAKATGFWSVEEKKITDIAGFVDNVEYLIKQTTVEISKKIPDVMESAGKGSQLTEVNAPVLEKGSKEEYASAAAVIAVMDHFGVFYNATRPDAKVSFGGPNGKISGVGSATLTYADGSNEEISAAKINVWWNGPVAARDEIKV